MQNSFFKLFFAILKKNTGKKNKPEMIPAYSFFKINSLFYATASIAISFNSSGENGFGRN